MQFTQLFLHSFNNPQKIAAFRILPIGRVMIYVFSFITLLTVISFVNFLSGYDSATNITGLLEYVNEMRWILLPFAFIIQFIMSTLLIFTRISLMAFIGIWLLKLLKRRGDYRHVWRTTAFAYTVPTLLSILFMYLSLPNLSITIFTNIICLIYLFCALRYYPKK
ncbi:MAG: DUF1189 family protein [Paenisporosarcina sp.]